MRGVVGRIGLLVAATLLSVVIAEGVVRLAGIAPHRYPRLRHLENVDKSVGLDLYPTNPRGSFDVDLRVPAQRIALEAAGLPEIEAARARTPFGVHFAYNAQRCRDRAFAPRVPGVRRIVVLGDSFTEGQGVREDETFVRGIERAWRADPTAPPMEIYNCGRRGRDFPALREAFDALMAERPDVVLYAMVLNDPEQSPSFRARQQFLNDWIVDRRRTTDGYDLAVHGSVLWAFLQDRFDAARVGQATTRWYVDMYGTPNRDGWAATQRSLAQMDQVMRARGGVFGVAVLPLMVRLEHGYPFDGVHAEIARACARLALHCHDTLPAFRGAHAADLWVHAVDLHPNERAHAMLAHDLTPWVRQL